MSLATLRSPCQCDNSNNNDNLLEKEKEKEEGEDTPPIDLAALHSQRDVFEAFASEEWQGVRYMTPNDVLRSLSLDPRRRSHRHHPPQTRSGKEQTEAKKTIEKMEALLALADTNFDGRISFSEYQFFLKLLKTPPHRFLVAFRAFDLDDSGYLDVEEFKKIILAQGGSSETPKENASIPENSLLVNWFGKNGEKQLSFVEFVKFLEDLQREMIVLQFQQYEDSARTISGEEFGLLLLSHASLLPGFLGRWRTLPDHLKQKRISLDRYLAFERTLQRLHEVTAALRIFGNETITPGDFQMAVRRLLKVDLSDDMVQILFHVFDKSGKKEGHIEWKDLLNVQHHYTILNQEENKMPIWERVRVCLQDTNSASS